METIGVPRGDTSGHSWVANRVVRRALCPIYATHSPTRKVCALELRCEYLEMRNVAVIGAEGALTTFSPVSCTHSGANNVEFSVVARNGSVSHSPSGY